MTTEFNSMRTALSHVFVIALCAGVVSAGSWWRRRAIVEPAYHARLIVQPDSLDLGKVWETQRHPARVVLHNPTRKPVELIDVAWMPDNKRITPTVRVIPPGGALSVDLDLDLTLHRPRHSQRFEYDANVALSVLERDGPPALPWRIRARVRRPLLLAPSRVDFSETLVAGESAPARNVEVQAFAPLTPAQGGLRLGSSKRTSFAA